VKKLGGRIGLFRLSYLSTEKWKCPCRDMRLKLGMKTELQCENQFEAGSANVQNVARESPQVTRRNGLKLFTAKTVI
jgi:hypothetical protein